MQDLAVETVKLSAIMDGKRNVLVQIPKPRDSRTQRNLMNPLPLSLGQRIPNHNQLQSHQDVKAKPTPAGPKSLTDPENNPFGTQSTGSRKQKIDLNGSKFHFQGIDPKLLPELHNVVKKLGGVNAISCRMQGL
jgi:hypothetical protein